MANPEDDRLWKLKFAVEVSTRYHDWRRATLERYAAAVKVISIFGAFLTFAAVTDWFNVVFGYQVSSLLLISIFSVLIAAINILDLVFNTDGKARLHTELYRRFKALQEIMAREQDKWPERISEWEADSQAIRIDEPPVKWAIYFMCWNQTLIRHDLGSSELYEITRWQKLLRNFRDFRPQDFHLAGPPTAAAT